jgi:Gpi18-like mannosyltransferase
LIGDVQASPRDQLDAIGPESGPWPRAIRAVIAARLQAAAPALAAYAAIRVIGFMTMAWIAPQMPHRGHYRSLGYLVGAWDAGWYRRIAIHGYNLQARHDPSQLPKVSSFAWFPGYPGTVDTLQWMPGLGLVRAGLLVTLIAGFAAAWGLMALGVELTGDRRIGVLLAALWAVAPGSLVLQMGYTEALFCALAAWTLVALARRNWLTAGVLACLAGTVRSTAAALIVAVFVAVAVQLVRNRANWRRPLAGALLAPLGLVGYWAFVGWATGKVDGWFWVERNLTGMPFDWGRYTMEEIQHVVFGPVGQPHVLVVLVLVGSLILLLWTFAERLPLYTHAYTLMLMVSALGTGSYFGSKPRFLLPVLLLALPLARLLSNTPKRVLIPLFGFFAAASTWFGMYLMATLPP